MDLHRLNHLACSLPGRISRRMIASLLTGATASRLLQVSSSPVAAKKHKHKKVTLCHDGQTIQVSKKAKKKHLAHGDTLGTCSPPQPPLPGPNPACQVQYNSAIGGVRRAAVTFVAERTGQLAAAECRIASSGGGDFTLEIRSVNAAGVPTTTVLASDSITDFPDVSANMTLTAIFDPPAAVQSGTRYAFVVTSGPGQSVGVLTRTGNPCPGYQLFIDTAAANNYQPNANSDMLFYASIVV